MKVAHFLPSTFVHFFQRGQKVTLLGVFGDFSRFCQVYSFDGTMDPFFEKWIFWTNGHFLIFQFASTTNPCPFFVIFWSFFQKPPKWPFWPFLHVSRHGWELRTKKWHSAISKLTIFAIFSLFFHDFGPFSHLNTTRRRGTWRSKDRPGRAKTVKNHQKSSKISHFQTKSAFCWFCTNFDHFELNLCIGTMCHFLFLNQKFSLSLKKHEILSIFAHFSHFLLYQKISA